eukprot:scaffold22109_cov63-Phaeocystis_antarctica.AAC.7
MRSSTEPSLPIQPPGRSAANRTLSSYSGSSFRQVPAGVPKQRARLSQELQEEHAADGAQAARRSCTGPPRAPRSSPGWPTCCTPVHTPRLSSSGRSLRTAAASGASIATVGVVAVRCFATAASIPLALLS